MCIRDRTFTVDSNANLKEYALEAELRYTDGSNVYTKSEAIMVNVNRLAKSDMNLTILAVVFVLVIAFLGWRLKTKKGLSGLW